MSKSRFIFITGDDYGALNFEDSPWTLETIVQELELGKTREFEGDNYYFCATLHEFDYDIPEEFLEFVKRVLCDYDQLKHNNLYKIQGSRRNR